MPQDVIQAIQQQSQQVTAGQVGMPPTPAGQAFQYTLNVNGRLDDVAEFENMIVKTGSNGDVTRVRDVGRVELGAQTYSQMFSLNNRPATGIGVFQSPGANALEVEQAVKKKMAELAGAFPQDIKYDVPFDTTKFVSASIHEVYKTLIEAGFLVLVVILIFLQDWRAMLVPATTVPVTIIGAFAAMAALGFTINLSTLFAIVLAIGIVVDDAIVVVEGAAHNIEKGMSGHDAAISAMDRAVCADHRHHAGADIGVSAGRLPAGTDRAHVCAIRAGDRRNRAAQRRQRRDPEADAMRAVAAPGRCRRNSATGSTAASTRSMTRLERGYAGLIGRMVAHSKVSAVDSPDPDRNRRSTACRGCRPVFIPIEDQGYLLVAVQLPDGAALERTQDVLDQVSEIAGKTPGVGAGDQHRRHFGARQQLEPRQCRRRLSDPEGMETRAGAGEDLRSLFVGLNQKMAAIQQARIIVLPPPPIQGIGNAAGFAMQVELRDGNADFGKLQAITGAIVANAQTQSALQRVSSPFRSMVPQFDVESGPDQDPDAARHHRPGVLDTGVLSGIVLRQPVQQIRPHFPDLYPGRRAIPPDAARYRESDGSQPAGRHGPARHARDHYPGGGTLADQPVQSLSVLDRDRPARTGL